MSIVSGRQRQGQIDGPSLFGSPRIENMQAAMMLRFSLKLRV